MFNGSKGNRDERAAPAIGRGRGMFSVIGPDMAVTGEVRATADLHVDGGIEGNVQCGNLVQGAESVIVGGIVAETARIAGTVEGSVRVRHLTVERSARIAGDVEYQEIAIESGGHVEGRLIRIDAEAGAVTGPRVVPDALPAPRDQAA